MPLKWGEKHGRDHSMPAALLWGNTLQEPTWSMFNLFPSRTSLTAILLYFFIQTDFYTPQFHNLPHCPAPFWCRKLTCWWGRCLAPAESISTTTRSLLLPSSTGSGGGDHGQLYLDLTSKRIYYLAHAMTKKHGSYFIFCIPCRQTLPQDVNCPLPVHSGTAGWFTFRIMMEEVIC